LWKRPTRWLITTISYHNEKLINIRPRGMSKQSDGKLKAIYIRSWLILNKPIAKIPNIYTRKLVEIIIVLAKTWNSQWLCKIHPCCRYSSVSKFCNELLWCISSFIWTFPASSVTDTLSCTFGFLHLFASYLIWYEYKHCFISKI